MSSVIVSAIPAFLHDPDLEKILHWVSEGARVAMSLEREFRSSGILGKADQSPVTLADFAVQAVVAQGLQELAQPLPLMAEESAAMLEKPEHATLLRSVVQAVRDVCPGIDQASVLRAIDLGSPLAWEGDGNRPPRFFTLDPIDGTKGFIRGGHYVTAFSRIDQGEVDLAILACPKLVLDGGRLIGVVDQTESKINKVNDDKNRGTLLISIKNNGSWARPLFSKESPWQRLYTEPNGVTEQGASSLSPLSLSRDGRGEKQELCSSYLLPLEGEGARRVDEGEDQAPLRMLTSFESSHTDPERLTRFVHAFEAGKGGAVEQTPMDSQAKFALIAAGEADLMLRFRNGATEKIWDYAAGTLVVTEAGGRVSDLDGRPLDFSCGTTLARNRGLIVTRANLYARIFDALNSL